jgi:hypothetical protein
MDVDPRLLARRLGMDEDSPEDVIRARLIAEQEAEAEAEAAFVAKFYPELGAASNGASG